MLAGAYYGILLAGGGWSSAFKTLLENLDYCHLHLAVLWLGWSAEWSPPQNHAHDWLAEALRLADKLGL